MYYIMLILNLIIATLFVLGKIEISSFLMAAILIELTDLYCGVCRLNRKIDKCERIIEKYERKNN